MCTDRCERIGERIAGGFGGRGGISWSARMGDIGEGSAGSSIWRYHGIDPSEEGGGGGDGDDSGCSMGLECES